MNDGPSGSPRSLQLFHALLTFDERIATAPTLDDFRRGLNESMREAFPDVDLMSLWELEGDETEVTLLAELGHAGVDELTGIVRSEVFQDVVRAGEAAPLRAEEPDVKAALANSAAYADIKHLLYLPVLGDGSFRAFLLLAGRHAPIAESRIEQRVLKAFGAQAAREVHRVRLMREQRASSNLLVRAQERERRAISQDVHDQVGGHLNSLRLVLDMARTEDPTVAQDIDEAIDILSEVIDDVRDLSFRLSPRMLVDLGLVPTVRSYAKRFQARTRVDIRLHNEIDPAARFRGETEATAFRVVQESLTNVSKHAAAESVQIHLREDEDALVVHVIDTGRGFDPEDVSYSESGIGLRGLVERVDLVDGTLEVTSAPGEGTRISAILPK